MNNNRLDPVERALLECHYHAINVDLFSRCKAGLIKIIEQEIIPSHSGWFDEVDRLIDEFESGVKDLKLK